jgi:signal transduction histidine kinase
MVAPMSRGSMWWYRLRATLILVALVYGVASVGPRPGRSGAGLATLLLLVPAVVGWLLWTWQPAALRTDALRTALRTGAQRTAVVRTAALGVTLAAGLALTMVHPAGTAAAFPAFVCLWAGSSLPFRSAVAIALAAGLFFPLIGLVQGFGWWLAVGPTAFIVATMGGRIRRQGEILRDEADQARAREAHTAALAEQARVAREIHDVLAHSLSALTVQLETADALLEGGRTDQARQAVLRAGRLAREGLAETRRAIGALRGDTLPLPELLDALSAGYRGDLQAAATVRVQGPPRELGPDISLALYRTAQEAMTNVRKHAPGAPVRLDLRYGQDAVSLCIANGAAPAGAARPLATAGGGYGLTGLRERAKLAGGSFEAGPAADGYRVDVRIPV